MRATYFREPVDQYACVERAWRERLVGDHGPAIFLRSRPGRWAGTSRYWSIKYVLEVQCGFEVDGQACEVFEGFCFVIPAQCAYASTIRNGRILSVFGDELVGPAPCPSTGILGVFELGRSERRTLRDRVDALGQFDNDGAGEGPECGVEITLQHAFPLPRSLALAQRSLGSWAKSGSPRQRVAHRLVRARHFLTANFHQHAICASAAQGANMTRSHFSRQFAQLFGQSPRQYLVAYRSAVAQSLLRSGQRTVEQVANDLGYSHASSLAHLFQRRRLGNPRSLSGQLRSADSR